MSYEKQTWQTGDIVTADKLNHMEDGIESSGGVFCVTFNYDDEPSGEGYFTNVTQDHTFEEAMTAYNAGKLVVFCLGGIDAGEPWTWGRAIAYDDGGFLKASIVTINPNGPNAVHLRAIVFYLNSDEASIQMIKRTVTA